MSHCGLIVVFSLGYFLCLHFCFNLVLDFVSHPEPAGVCDIIN